jgi:hypothetical protein
MKPLCFHFHLCPLHLADAEVLTTPEKLGDGTPDWANTFQFRDGYFWCRSRLFLPGTANDARDGPNTRPAFWLMEAMVKVGGREED